MSRKVVSTDVMIPETEASCSLAALNAHIAAELAAGLSDAAAVRERYGISEAQWETLKRSPTFRHMLGEAVRTFRGDLNAGNRIQKKADIVLEDAIPAYDSMIHNSTIPASERVNAGKLIAQIAGRTAKTEGGGGVAGTGFVLNINLGERERLVIDGTNIPMPPEPDE